MPRQTLGLNLDESAIWGKDSSPTDRVILPTIEAGYSTEYNDSKFPDRRHLNYTLAQLTAIGADVNAWGAALPWHTGIVYNQNAIVTGSDGLLYRSEAAANIGYDPADAGNVPSKWREFSEIYGINDLKTDTEYVEVEYHPTGLYHEGAGSWYYAISQLQGAGVDVAEIRSLHVSGHVFGSNYHQGRILASLPSGQEINIAGSKGNNDDDDCGSYSSAVIPVNKNQSGVTIRSLNERSYGHGMWFRVHGVTQRTI